METMPSASHRIMALNAAAVVDTLEMRTLNVFNCMVVGQMANAARMKLASTDNACLLVNADQMHFAMFVTINRSASVHRDTEETAGWDAVHLATHVIRTHVVLTLCAKLTLVAQCASVLRG